MKTQYETEALETEINARLALGCEQLTVAGMERRFNALGYKLDRSMDCRGTARYVDSGRTYPCITTSIKEVDTGMNAFHYQARRDANFKAMQELRQNIFAVVRSAILEV